MYNGGSRSFVHSLPGTWLSWSDGTIIIIIPQCCTTSTGAQEKEQRPQGHGAQLFDGDAPGLYGIIRRFIFKLPVANSKKERLGQAKDIA